MNLSEILLHQHWLLSIVFLLLIALSLVSWYVIFKKIFFFNSEFKSFKNSNNSLSKKLLDDSFAAIKNGNSDLAKKKLNLLFEKFKDHLNFGQNFLASIANLTPFIGLFGTVIGVYLALMDISTEGSANIAVVAKPIGEALIATAFGLWCAIPASFAFNFFSKKASSLLKLAKLAVEEKLVEIEEKK
jgi:biopolymer transport protein ExbB/TolQ